MSWIAAEERVSRSTVSRWLKQAREQGLVEISVHAPGDGSDWLAQQIRARYGVEATVVAAGPSASESAVLEANAEAAAQRFAAAVLPGSAVGVAWGSTISAMARHLSPHRVPGVSVVQLNGAGSSHSSNQVYISDILRRFSQALTAPVEQFPVPAFFDDPRAKDLMWQERSVRRVLEQQSGCALAVFGIGALEARIPSRVYVGGYFDDDEIQQLRDEGAVGDIATRFFDAEGSDSSIRFNARTSAPTFEQLRGIPHRLCVVSGPAKVPGLRAALRAGLITEVVLDSVSAQQLLRTA